MEATFNIGDNVFISVDRGTVYEVIRVNNVNGTYFYDLKQLNDETSVVEVSEIQLELAI